MGERIATQLAKHLEDWSCRLKNVLVDNIDLIDPDMVRAIAREAEVRIERIES